MFILGRLEAGRVATTDFSSALFRRLFIKDRYINMCFFVVSVSDVSLVVSKIIDKSETVLKYYRATNGSKIIVYDYKIILLGLRRNFTYAFYICDVAWAILGDIFCLILIIFLI